MLRRSGRKSLLVGAVLIVVVGAAAAPARGVSFDRRVVDGRFSSGGEVVVDARRRLVLTADRDALHADAIAPGVSVVDADRARYRRTIPFWTQPWSFALPPGGTDEPALMPQVAFGIERDERRGLVVTSNSLTDTVTVARAGATITTARNRIFVGDHPFGVAIDEQAGLAYVAMYGDGRIDVIDLATRRVVDAIGGLVSPTKLALDPGAGLLYVGNADRAGGDDSIAVVDVRRRVVRSRIPVDPNSRPTVDVRAGRVYAASFVTGRIAVIDAAAATVARWVETGGTPHGIAVDEANDLLYAPNLQRGTVTVLDRQTLALVATEPVDGVPLGVAVDPRTGWAWISSRDASTLTALRPR